MTKYRALVDIMPHKALLDPQGKAVASSMVNVGIPEIQEVRIGKHIELSVDAKDQADASQKVEEACKKLLVNQITETFTFTVEPV